MKGRIIGREGRNIRALETATGVDLIVDDTPGAVLLSCFDPVRREVARLALATLMPGRPHPPRAHRGGGRQGPGRAGREDLRGRRGGGARAGLPRRPPRAPEAHRPAAVPLPPTGRTCSSTPRRSRGWPATWPPSSASTSAVAKRAGLLHDIGKAIDREMEGTHLELGRELLRKYGESRGGHPRHGVPPRRRRPALGRGGPGHRRGRAVGRPPGRPPRDPRELPQAAREARERSPTTSRACRRPSPSRPAASCASSSSPRSSPTRRRSGCPGTWRASIEAELTYPGPDQGDGDPRDAGGGVRPVIRSLLVGRRGRPRRDARPCSATSRGWSTGSGSTSWWSTSRTPPAASASPSRSWRSSSACRSTCGPPATTSGTRRKRCRCSTPTPGCSARQLPRGQPRPRMVRRAKPPRESRSPWSSSRVRR